MIFTELSKIKLHQGISVCVTVTYFFVSSTGLFPTIVLYRFIKASLSMGISEKLYGGGSSRANSSVKIANAPNNTAEFVACCSN